MSYPIIIEDYNPTWPKVFDSLKVLYRKHLGDYILDIQHVGSTSVPGLAAKPKLDIDIIVMDEKDAGAAIAGLEKLGYTHAGDLGLPGREAFRRKDDTTPDDGSGRVWMAHNLYVCLEGCPPLKNHLAFRDYLRSHPEKVNEYAALKKKLALKFPNDIDTYCVHKTEFVTHILELAGLERDLVKDIRIRNKMG